MSRTYSGIPHKWAHRVTNRAGIVAGKAGNVYYEGEKIYSYGRHFCIARLLPSDVVVFGQHTYSASTGQHQYAVQNAASHLKMVYCYDPDSGAYLNKERTAYEIEQALAEPAKLAKFKELKRLGGKVQARHLAKEFNDYLAALPEKEQDTKPFDLSKFDLTPEEAVRYTVLLQEERERQRLRDLRSDERRATRYEWRKMEMVAAGERAKTRIPDWRNHRTHASLYGLPTMLRLSEDGKNIETSHGADIPVSHAKRLWPIIENCRSVKQGITDRDIRLGHYTLTEIRADGSIVVGCHDIPYEEIELMAKALGLIEVEGETL